MRAKGHAISRQRPRVLLGERLRREKAVREQRLPAPQVDAEQVIVQIAEQDFIAELAAYKAEKEVQQGGRFDTYLTQGYEMATRLLPYARLAAETVKAASDFKQQQKYFQEQQRLAIKSNVTAYMQMGKSAIQFFVEETIKFKQASVQFKQSEARFEIQRKDFEKEATATMRKGVASAAFTGAEIGVGVGLSFGGPIGAAAGGGIGFVVGGGLSYGAAQVPRIWCWVVKTAKNVIEKCTF